jgi:N-acetyl-anhydromuramyl-L-alanine amidase AmpD
MITIDKEGIIRDSRVKVKLFPLLAHGPLKIIDAIVVHQTDSSTAESAFANYRAGDKGTGAHMLIDKDGTVYQTVSLHQVCWHVGKLKARCYEEHSCIPAETQLYSKWQNPSTVNKREQAKAYPKRWPGNSDSIGIEMVGKSLDEHTFEKPTPEQQHSLQWLVQQLLESLHLKRTDVYRHPQVSFKNPGEARDAVW